MGVRRIVVKVGTSTLTNEEGYINHGHILMLADELVRVRATGAQVLLVTSGSIAVGLEELSLPGKRPEDMPTLQAAAAVGQAVLMRTYEAAFGERGVKVGQILLTRGITERRDAYLNARNTVERLLELGALPIVNENDTVAVDEVRFGDNDSLAALVATLVDADLVVLLSDIDGLYTADPRVDEDARLLDRVSELTDEVVVSAGGAGTSNGSGGMATKIAAARSLMAAGIPMVICQGSRPDAVLDAVEGRQVGTRFEADAGTRNLRARKLWIALGGSPHGTITIDDGALHALRDRGGSLLPVGVTCFSGTFNRGDPIELRDVRGALVGRGLVGCSSDELALMVGRRKEDIASNKLIAHLAGRSVVHRDQLVVM